MGWGYGQSKDFLRSKFSGLTRINHSSSMIGWLIKTSIPTALLLLWSAMSGWSQISDSIDNETIIEYEIIDRFEAPLPSINYLTETGIGLNKGELYYQNILLFGQKFGFGITDHFSLNMGFEVYSLFDGRTPSILIAPKVTFNDRDASVKFGLGTNFVFISDFGSDQIAGSFYGLATFGGTDNNLTLGVGVGYDSYGISDTPVFQLSGQLRLSNHFGLVMDSLSIYYDADYNTATSLFFRYMNRKLIIDLGGLIGLTGPESIPLANFAIRLN